MRKRGINPLIATVFLVAFAFLIGIVVMIFASETVEREIGVVEEEFDMPLVVLFNAEYAGNCSINTTTTCEGPSEDNACYNLRIENPNEFDTQFRVETFSDKGSDFCGPVHVPPRYTKFVAVYYNVADVGSPNDPENPVDLWADVEPLR